MNEDKIISKVTDKVQVEYETVYMVLKVLKKAEYISPLTGKVMETEFTNMLGYLPVFKTIIEAQANSNNGEFNIVPIKIEK